MKKLILAGLVAPLLCCQVFAQECGWKTDSQMKFFLAYLPEAAAPGVKAPERPASMNLTPAYMADINNINLAAIKSLGFALPSREKDAEYNLFLKFFNYPGAKGLKRVPAGIVGDFRMEKLGGGVVARYAAEAHNDAVKFAYVDSSQKVFSEQVPFPPLLIDPAVSAKEFLRSVPFVSLYLSPDCKPAPAGTEDEKAAYSARGVLAFHKELLAAYKKSLKSSVCAEPEKYDCFEDAKSVIRVQKQPSVFANWRQLPMPSDPQRHFLSGLLLVYRSEKTAAGLKAPMVFEVGSLTRLP